MKAFELAIAQPWAILPEMLTTILNVAARETDPEAVAAKLGRPLENTYKAEFREGVAILPVTGPIMRYANLFSNVSGATSIDVLATDFNQTLENPDVKAIIFNIDSPGGTVAGVNEFSEMIYAARGRKPMTAYVSGIGASAAYWIASSCDDIVMDATASVGSIGVVSVQNDDTQRKEKIGIKEIQIVSSLSPRKRLDLSTEEGRADVQAMVDSIAHVFVAAVARNRAVNRDSVLSDFGQGSLLVGIDAVNAGMADRIGSLESIIAGLSGTFKRRNMMTETKNESSEITAAFIAQHHSAIAESFRAEGAQKERQRIKDIEEQHISGHETLIQTLKFDGKTTGAEAAVQILAAEKQARIKRLANLKEDAPQALPMPGIQLAEKHKPVFPDDPDEEELPEDEKLEAQWRKDPKIRAEFHEKETFMAYMKAQANGQVHLLKQA